MPNVIIVRTRYYEAAQDAISQRVRIRLAKGVTSDASPDRWPPVIPRVSDDNETINENVEADEATVDDWRRKLGEFLTLIEVKPHLEQEGKKFTGVVDRSTLHKFPENYKLYVHKSQDRRDPRLDYYLYGSTHTPYFRSAKEFAPHLHWLMQGSPKKSNGRPDCQCKYCSDRKQTEINKIYFPGGDGKEDRDGDDHNRGRRRIPRKQEPRIQYKDYTQLHPDQIAP